MSAPIEQLAQFVANTQWEDIPESVRDHSKRVLMDTLGVILAGSEQPEMQQLQKQLIPRKSSGSTVYARGWPSRSPQTAALLNGIAGRSIELCEGHRYVSCQAAIQMVPTILALGESQSSSGRDLLSALIVGYDVAVRIGSGVTARALAHQNGQAPMLGAVAAGARLYGLNAADTSRALRIGATLLLTPSYTNAVAGATVLNVAGGMSGFVGALAPELALAGFAAQEDAIEEAFSSLVGDGFQADGIADELGQRWEISRNYFRLRACCNPMYSALDALEDILADLQPQPEAIERIDVATYQFASNMRNPTPKNTFAARYSFPHAASALIVKGTAGYAAFTEEALHDPTISALRQRIQVTEDPTLSAQAPRLKPARVTLTLKDGQQRTQLIETARGDFQAPYPPAALQQKFHELAGLLLTPDGVSATQAAIEGCDQWSGIDELLHILRANSRHDTLYA